LVAIREKSATVNPHNLTWQHHLAIAFMLLGDSVFEKNNPEPALVPWRKSRAIMERITAIYPEQIEWQIDLCAVLNRIGDVLRNIGQFQEALKVYERQLQLAEGVLARDPSNVLAQSNQGINKERVAWTLFALGRIEDALPYFDEAIQIKVSLRQERNQKSEAFTYWERAIARMYVGRLEDAAQDLQNAINLNPEEMYYPIWLHIVRSRLGVDDRPELAANVKDYDFSKWPGAIIALYLGQHDEAAVHNIALATEKETDRADNVCASDLYGAIHQLAKGSQTEGRRLLQSAADHCAPSGVWPLDGSSSASKVCCRIGTTSRWRLQIAIGSRRAISIRSARRPSRACR
jgi:tetratricopeptide (TPR) repeat protein